MSESFYDILGVNRGAKQEDIKKAYRGLSLKYHPDRNPSDKDAKTKFQKINEAYETLGDDEKRRQYDAPKNQFADMFSSRGDVEDIFNAFFGVGMQGQNIFQTSTGAGTNPFHFMQNMHKPTPIVKSISVSIEQVLTGVTMPIDIDRWIIENNNKTFEHETLYITIPKGIDDGEIIVMREKGNVLTDAIKGDIKIFVKVENQTEFERKGLDLIVTKHISLREALCGFVFEMKYINGKVYSFNNNSGNIVKPDHKKVIPNMGLTRDTHVGNLIIVFKVDFPDNLTSDQILKINDLLK
jgi:DnaJ family protein B protein 4